MQKNEPTGMTGNDMIGIEDEIGEEISANMRGQLESEKALWEKNLTLAEAGIKNYSEQWDIEQRLWALKLDGDNIKPINPASKVEQLDEWWDLQKKMAEFKFRETKHFGDRKLEELKAQRDKCAEELKQVIEALAKLDA